MIFSDSHVWDEVHPMPFPEELPKGGGPSPTSAQFRGESLVSALSPQADPEGCGTLIPKNQGMVGYGGGSHAAG